LDVRRPGAVHTVQRRELTLRSGLDYARAMAVPWGILATILLSDVLNPVLFGALIFALGSRRPYANAVALIVGHTATYMAAGVLLAIGFERLDDLLANPRPIDFVIETILGLVLLAVAFVASRPPRPQARAAKQLAARHEPGLIASFGQGALLNLVGLPFAVPYFAALDQVLKADLDWAGAVLVLGVYNAGYALPFVAVIGLRAALGESAAPLLHRINGWIGKAADVLLPILLLLLGGALLADAGAYFWRGRPLF